MTPIGRRCRVTYFHGPDASTGRPDEIFVTWPRLHGGSRPKKEAGHCCPAAPDMTSEDFKRECSAAAPAGEAANATTDLHRMSAGGLRRHTRQRMADMRALPPAQAPVSIPCFCFRFTHARRRGKAAMHYVWLVSAGEPAPFSISSARRWRRGSRGRPGRARRSSFPQDRRGSTLVPACRRWAAIAPARSRD